MSSAGARREARERYAAQSPPPEKKRSCCAMTVSLDEGEFLFTSESVTEGHPDKIADQISDAVLDTALAADPYSRVACETVLTTGLVLVAGEITTSAHLDIPEIVRSTIRDIGYTSECGFDGDACAVLVALDRQSPD